MRVSKRTSFVNDRLLPGDRVMAIGDAGLFKDVDDVINGFTDLRPATWLNEGTTLLIISKQVNKHDKLMFLVVASLGDMPLLGWIVCNGVYGFDLPMTDDEPRRPGSSRA